MRRILFIDPLPRDHRELQYLRNQIPVTYIYHSIGDYTMSLDISDTYRSLIDEIEMLLHGLENTPIDGVLSTNDYPSQIVASIIAHEKQLPGPDPHILLPLQDKHYMRTLQREIVPESTPAFETISADHPHLKQVQFPCIVKPIKAAGSLGTLYIRNQDELELIPDIPDLYFEPLHELLAEYSTYTLSENTLLAEAFANGEQVTVDGFVYNGEITVIGIVDCHVDPHTLAFSRFIYPSRLPHNIQEQMEEIATTLTAASGLDNTFFNIEMRYDADTDTITIIEMNTRMSSQFADMYEKVDGYHPYRVAMDIACGKRPDITYRQGKYRIAQHICLHTDADYYVERTPTPDEKYTVLRDIPDTRIKLEVMPGKRMSDCDNALFIYGYALIQLGGNSDEEIEEKFEHARAKLPFRFSR